MRKIGIFVSVALGGALLGGGCLRRSQPVVPPRVAPKADIRAIEFPDSEAEALNEEEYAAFEDQAMVDEELAKDAEAADLSVMEEPFMTEGDANLQIVP